MDSLEKQRIESQIRQLADTYAMNFKGMIYRQKNTFTGIEKFTPEFLNHLPSGVRAELEKLEKELNAS